MTRWLLNSAVIAAPGTYEYRLLDRGEARIWLTRPEGFISRVGYAETAAYLRDLAGVTVPLSREASIMEPGDEALVVRLKCRVGNPAAKGQVKPGAEDWELGLLRRLA